MALLAMTATALLPRIPQDPCYHDFADQRRVFGIPHFQNVLSNFPFLWVGAVGLLRWRRHPRIRPSRYTAPGPTDLAIFAGIFTTGLGSAYYHWQPTTARLVFDRLPMTIVFMGLFAAVLQDRVSPQLGRRSLFPLLAIGFASVFYWAYTESIGAGDLRPYAFVQYFPCVIVPAILVWTPPKREGTPPLVLAAFLYLLAKVAEAMDAQIYAAGQVVSGHVLKHLIAALATLALARHFELRRLGYAAGVFHANDVKFETTNVLKRDHLGSIETGVLRTADGSRTPAIQRDVRRANWFARPFAKLLANREACALGILEEVEGIPRLFVRTPKTIIRSFIPGVTFREGRPVPLPTIRKGRSLLRATQERGVTHNDTHKDVNWLASDSGDPALIDFQLAAFHPSRSRWFRTCAAEDLRHLLKHQKRSHPDSIRCQARKLLSRRSLVARTWRRLIKPAYRFLTRTVLRWRDGEGRGFGDRKS